MEEILLNIGLKDGIFAAMFIWLLVYVLKTTREREDKAAVREDKLYTFLNDMKIEFSKLVGNYENLSKDVTEIKNEIHSKKKE